MDSLTSSQRSALTDFLVNNFTADELRFLTYTLFGDGAYEELSGTSKVGKVTRLLGRLESEGRIRELVSVIEKQYPSIQLPDFEAEGRRGLQEERLNDIAAKDSVGGVGFGGNIIGGQQVKIPGDLSEVPPQVANTLRERRPGYDRIRDLVSRYERKSPNAQVQIEHVLLIESYIQPMFEALGWSVRKEVRFNAERGIQGSQSIWGDLLLSYRDLRVPVEVKLRASEKDTDQQMLRLLSASDTLWGCFTNFETICLLRLETRQKVSLVVESSPRHYLADADEIHDLLAAEIFYNKFVEGSNRSKSVETLIRSLRDPNDVVRKRAVETLGEIGDSQAVEHLIPVLNDPNEDIRYAAVVALGKIGDSHAIAGLSRLQQYPNDAIRLAVIEAIGNIEAKQSANASNPVEPPIEPEPRQRIDIAVRALADSPSKVDLLGFTDYAKALADFIRNEKTEKPLTIGIDADWGMGKTTLMGMIRDELGKRDDKLSLWRRIEACLSKRDKKQWFLTVWFNAWKYNQEESLWAALALEILGQVRKQLNWRQRLRLNWMLNMKRLDWERIIWGSLKSLFHFLVLCLFVSAILFSAGLLWGSLAILKGTDFLEKYFGTVSIFSFISVLYGAIKEFRSLLHGAFDLGINRYVHSVDYSAKVGFLAEFEKDFRRVVEVVTGKGKWPLVVFIDDLDRCSPPKPVEIVEAINVLLGAEHCVFIIGMDAQAVAYSIEAKYKDLCERVGNAGDPGGMTLGRRFLEKIVQINFRIPRAPSKSIRDFIDAHLGVLSERSENSLAQEKTISEAERLIEAEQRTGRSLDEAAEQVKAIRSDIHSETIESAKKSAVKVKTQLRTKKDL